ncbi:hypothetical protein DPMN_024963 [Dreissena polymorpha]|uniref:Uncharacterized protein n=1 Tax=Dreissena polymorpha TaxID=45954 RepID=A0A9D4LQD6_DREPO|nr:hypothetical protein DPMN_024963 [Dreissena polymorpha]
MSIFLNLNAECDGKTDRQTDRRTDGQTVIMTKVHEDWAKNATSRVFTCLHYKQKEKPAPPPCGHFFPPPISTNFELKTAPPSESTIFPPILTIFELVHDINKTNILTKFHDGEKM